MIGHLWKLALIVALSHGYRVVGRNVGPRWAGLITALPCSTAVALLGGGSDRGVDYAVSMAGACWVGLAGASALPLAFASATVAGWGLLRSAVLAAVSYFAVVVGVVLVGRSLGNPVPAALGFLALATFLATRIGEPPAWLRFKSWSLSAREVFWLRTTVPMICLSPVIGLGERLGPDVAGYLGAFPGVTLTALMLTRLEAGPVPSVRMSRALPLGNWAMVAFLATFTQTGQSIGLCGGFALSYAAALACLGAVAHLTHPPTLAQLRGQSRERRDRLQPDQTSRVPSGTVWPRTPRRFSPLVESIAA